MTNKPPGQSAKAKKSAHFVFWPVSLFIVTGLVGIVGYMEYSAHLIASQGQLATATITGKVMHPAGLEGYTKTAYEEDFTFTTAEGKRIEGKTDLTADSWDRIKPGGTFKVTYAASDPSTYHIGTDTSTTFSDCIFLGVLVIWVVLLWLTIRARHKRPSPRTAAAPAPDTAADAPRRGVAKASINGRGLLGAAVLLVVGGGFLLTGVVGLVSERGFRVHGKAATAIVLTKSSGHVGVRFTTDEGKLIETRTDVESPTMESLHEHLPVKIIYAPEHPEKIRLASDDQFTTFVFWGFFAALGAILAIAGVIVMSFGFLDAKRERLQHAVR